jgi:hypothetical protein
VKEVPDRFQSIDVQGMDLGFLVDILNWDDWFLTIVAKVHGVKEGILGS